MVDPASPNSNLRPFLHLNSTMEHTLWSPEDVAYLTWIKITSISTESTTKCRYISCHSPLWIFSIQTQPVCALTCVLMQTMYRCNACELGLGRHHSQNHLQDSSPLSEWLCIVTPRTTKWIAWRQFFFTTRISKTFWRDGRLSDHAASRWTVGPLIVHSVTFCLLCSHHSRK